MFTAAGRRFRADSSTLFQSAQIGTVLDRSADPWNSTGRRRGPLAGVRKLKNTRPGRQEQFLARIGFACDLWGDKKVVLRGG